MQHEKNPTSIGERFQAYAIQIFEEIQEILRSSPTGKVLVQLVLPFQADQPLYSALLALLKTAQLENPHFIGQVIEIEAGTQQDMIKSRLQENSLCPADQWIRYQNGRRYVAHWSELTTTVHQITMPWRDKGVYLITGGAGHLGLLFSQEIANHVSHATLILTGRSPLTSEQSKHLQEITSSGVEIHYEQVDVTDEQAILELIQNIHTTYGNIHGIIHSAGIIHDKFIIQKSREQFLEVLAPKVNGLVHIDQATQEQKLDFFVIFSSTAASFGNAGQADYATANAFMDAYAHYRNTLVAQGQRYGHTLSLNWPLWKEGGMHLDREAEEMIAYTTGITAMDTSHGMKAFYQGLASGLEQIVVMNGSLPHLQNTFLDQIRTDHLTSLTSSSNIQNNTHVSVTKAQIYEKALHYFKKLLAPVINVPIERIQTEAALEIYGIDSIMVMKLTNRLEHDFGPLPKTLFFEYQTIQELATYFITNYYEVLQATLQIVPPTAQNLSAANGRSASVRIERSQQEHAQYTSNHRMPQPPGTPQTALQSREIAIIGVAGRYPGAQNMQEFWQNLYTGTDSVSDIPDERWAYMSHTSHRWGGFLKHVDHFDPLFFNISPRDAEIMDPQERLFLECVYETLEDAGYTRETLQISQDADYAGNVGVFVGAMYHEYQLYGAQEQLQGHAIALSGNAAAIANRISYFCNFTGPSITIDTMCSSSLAALHMACQSIFNQDCRVAIAGGVNVSIHTNKYVALEAGNFLSSNGRCASFGADGDGYVPGEGVGAVLLKALPQALADGDHIYATIKGTAINHGGKTNGYTVPNPHAQANVIERAFATANIDPRTISYIEAHGTGTSLGDPIEITSLTKAFRKHTPEQQFCALGSVKSNIGHTESAAGIAALTKVLLQMQHQQLVPSLHAQTSNPHINFAQTPFFIQQELTAWQRPTLLDGEHLREYPRRAGISSFGAGGSNAHIIVEEYIPTTQEQPVTMTPPRPALIVLSAKSQKQLHQRAEHLLSRLYEAQNQAVDLAAVAYTLQVGREGMEERLAFVAVTYPDLINKLEAFLTGQKEIEELYRGQARSHKELLEIFASDEDLTQTLQAWIDKGKYHKLLQLWVKGLQIDWTKLYTDIHPRRISLPTYPFAHQRYWVPTNTSFTKTPELATTPNTRAMLHPLVQHNTSDFFSQRFQTTLTGEEFFLADHVVQGQRILPAVAYLEMARVAIMYAMRTAEKNKPSILRLHNVIWLRPLVVNEQKVSIQLELALQKNGEIAFTVSDQTLIIDEQPLRYSQGNARLLADAESEYPFIDLSLLRRQCQRQPLPATSCYQTYRALGIHYGSHMQGLESILVGDEQVLAQLSLPASFAQDTAPFMLHPSLLDAAIQAGVGLMPRADAENVTHLPFSLDELVLLRPLSPQAWAWVRRQPTSPHKLDIDISDEQGQVCVRLRGLATRTLQPGPPADSPQQDQRPVSQNPAVDRLHLLYPSWDPLVIKDEKRMPAANEQILIVGGTPEQLHVLTEIYPDAITLPICADHPIVHIVNQLQELPSIDHLFWIAPLVHLSHVADEKLIQSQEEGVLHCFRWLKALLQLSYGNKRLGCTFITTQAQQIHTTDPLNPAHASLHGLIGSLAKEYPSWQVRLLDLPLQEPWPLRQLLTLPSDQSGRAWVYRQQQWYRQELLPLSPPSTQIHEHYRQGGVYVITGGAGGIGQIWSEYLIRTYRAQLIWIGRRPLDARIQAQREYMNQWGPLPDYIQADATNLEELTAAGRHIKEVYPRLHGIIQSTIVLHDRSIASMEQEHFQATLAAKVDVNVRLAQVFAPDDLDFVLFFSSLNAFATQAGQSNYAAACTFEEAFARYLRQHWSCPVKIMHWGYWGSVGIVATTHHREQMARLGQGSIEPPEALEAVATLLNGPLHQLALLKTTSSRPTTMLATQDSLSLYPQDLPSSLQQIQQHVSLSSATRTYDEINKRQQKEEIETLLSRLLSSQLQSMGLFNTRNTNLHAARVATGILEAYTPWLQQSITLLAQRQKITRPDDSSISHLQITPEDSQNAWKNWESQKIHWLQDTNLSAQVRLVETMLRALPAILRGSQRATEIMFPHGTLELIEGIYQHNEVVDYFNEILIKCVISYVENQLPQIENNATPGIRILEIGAGTGGTSAPLLQNLRPYQHYIQEYCYTDISEAFLQHAQQVYAPLYPFLATRLFNVERDPGEQGIDPGSYDLVIAANVVHATRQIRHTLRNTKAIMKTNGLLLLNEISSVNLYTHLTFGLLDGWWSAEDPHLRMQGSPGLTIERWENVLKDEGFPLIFMPTRALTTADQQIIVAESNGLIRRHRSYQLTDQSHTAAQKSAQPLATPPTAPSSVTVRPKDTMPPDIQAQTLAHLKNLIGTALKLSPDLIDITEPFQEYGLDSILIVQLTDNLRKIMGEISSSLFFEYPTIATLTDHFLQTRPEELRQLFTPTQPTQSSPPSRYQTAQPESQEPTRLFQGQSTTSATPSQADISTSHEPIAIVGLAGRYPGAPDLDSFWENLSAGKSSISEIPAERWKWQDYFVPIKGKQGSVYTKWGGFLSEIDAFDPLFFGISPREARQMDPQERLFLETTYSCIQDAGYTPQQLDKQQQVGIFVGVMNSNYPSGTRYWSIANRISYLLNFHGPSIALDTACSSSLTAIHLAIESLRHGTCTSAIAGGVNLIVDPVHYLRLSEANMLSSGEQCRAFGEQADGFVDGEGVGALLLKPLASALADGDHIYGLIKGSMINAGGKTAGYTVPNPQAQAQVISEALRRAHVPARSISYLEAHGTGTSLGDPIEIAGLTRAFTIENTDTQYCALGSVKSNIGHTESASGIAGLTKILLQLKHQQLVPSLHAHTPNRHIDFASTPFRLQQEPAPWTQPRLQLDGVWQQVPRRAGISSFGAGGANAHIIIEEYLPDIPENNTSPQHPVLIVLSAQTEEQLRVTAQNLRHHIQVHSYSQRELPAIAYTLQVGREAMEERLAFQSWDIEDMLATLAAFLDATPTSTSIYRGRVRQVPERTLSTDGAQQTLERFLVERDYTELLNLWSRGFTIDWHRLYTDTPPHRISLPTYPFARERYWLSGGQRKTTLMVTPLHPLVQQNTSHFHEQRFSSIFSEQEFFLHDHKVRGKSVMPAVAYLEMARAAIMLALDHRFSPQPQFSIRLQDIVWVHPIIVETQPVQVHITLSQDNVGTIKYKISGPSGEIDSQPIIYSQGRASLQTQAEAPALDISVIQRHCQQIYTSTQCYDTFHTLGITYGPAHRALEEIYVGPDQVLARLSLPASIAHTLDQFILHPSLLDGALQAMQGLHIGRIENIKPSLLFALEELNIFGSCTSIMWAWVHYDHHQPDNQEQHTCIQKITIEICDTQGNVAIQMKGVSCRMFEDGEAWVQDSQTTKPISETPNEKSPPKQLLPEDSRLDFQYCLHLSEQISAGAITEDQLAHILLQ